MAPLRGKSQGNLEIGESTINVIAMSIRLKLGSKGRRFALHKANAADCFADRVSRGSCQSDLVRYRPQITPRF